MEAPQMLETPVQSGGDATAVDSLQSASSKAHLERGVLLAYGGPSAGHGFTFLLTGIYLMSFSTDVLLVAPGSMALIFGLSRIWDAISDPLVGYLTDRTRLRFGRRRSWMLVGAIPMALAFAMLWSPPADLSGGAVTWWLGIALIAFYTASTAVDVPHSALGAELSPDYHERTRLFGYRRIFFGLGSLLAVGGVWAFGQYDPRAVGRAVGIGAGLLLIALVFACVFRVRERSDFQGRGAPTPWAGLRDVWANPHARILLGVFLLQQLAVTGVSVAIPYFSKYVLGTPEWTSLYIGALFLSSLVSVPVWMSIAPHYDKRILVTVSMIGAAVAISCLGFAPVGMPLLAASIAALGGLAVGGLDVLFPSIQADVIDVDEHRTGERKEGAYFSAWAFSAKTAGGLASMAVGGVLAAFGFQPNVEQTPAMLFGMRGVAGLLPAFLYICGLLLFLRFSLSQGEHERIRRDLDARRVAADGGGVEG